eukprot:268864_1
MKGCSLFLLYCSLAIALSQIFQFTSTLGGSNWYYGHMFDIKNIHNAEIRIQRFNVRLSSAKAHINIYTRAGSYYGHSSNSSGWTQIHSQSSFTGGWLSSLSNSVNVTPQSTQAFFFDGNLIDTPGSSEGAVYKTGEHLIFYEGNAIDGFGGNTIPAIVWNGVIEYSTSTLSPTLPSHSPTPSPTPAPTRQPTPSPTPAPTIQPTPSPTPAPTNNPSFLTPSPTQSPTPSPTYNPTPPPTFSPTEVPTDTPTDTPTKDPTQSTQSPTHKPTIYARILTPSPVPVLNATMSNTQQNDVSGENEKQHKAYAFSWIIIIVVLCILCILCILSIGCIYKKRKKHVNIRNSGLKERLLSLKEMTQPETCKSISVQTLPKTKGNDDDIVHLIDTGLGVITAKVNDDNILNETAKVKKNVDYKTWNYEDTYEWIMSLENDLLINVRIESVNGECLSLLDSDDLHRLGIHKLKHKKILLTHIKQLLSDMTVEGA